MEKLQNWRTIVKPIFFFRIVGFFLQKKSFPEQFIIVIPRRNDFKICQCEGLTKQSLFKQLIFVTLSYASHLLYIPFPPLLSRHEFIYGPHPKNQIWNPDYFFF